jgi:hypothetical protein
MLLKYSVGGVTLASEVPLPELGSASPGRDPDWSFQLGPTRARPPRERWFHRWTTPHGRQWLALGRDDDAYVLRFARTATFRVAPARQSIVCEGAALVPARTVRHLLLNQVLPLALTRTKCVLHASAVVQDGGAMAFAGQTGSGKSTLSTALSRAGATLMCDDALVVDPRGGRFYGVPMYNAVRLWPDSVEALFDKSAAGFPTVSHYNVKRIVKVSNGSPPDAPALLRVICVMAAKDEMRRARQVACRALTPRDALMRLTPFAFHLDVCDADQLRQHFERLASVVERVPVIELVYPWRLGALADTAGHVLGALAKFQ